ncbi:hypothetical protein [Pseudoblastomonas halimionae]|uniref:Uncharacterized protein n=1 Tax=Alteriqipengyuania halimionae TaxID=1926630 RepID=A0A6I4U8Y8_9SPHN|nr:hypothetical protein [Alteriqipengyuania halimionae]MXP10962.1 hypothetical protein [Alteriqipengyuania halimionae]
MSSKDDKMSREERLAAKLRENLRRRKAQARAIGSEANAPGHERAQALPKTDSDR